MSVQAGASTAGAEEHAIVVRSSRDEDVDAMLRIYLHHVRKGSTRWRRLSTRRRRGKTSNAGARTWAAIACPISSPNVTEQ